jgi:hypothetical protein
MNMQVIMHLVKLGIASILRCGRLVIKFGCVVGQ